MMVMYLLPTVHLFSFVCSLWIDPQNFLFCAYGDVAGKNMFGLNFKAEENPGAASGCGFPTVLW